MKIQKLLLCLMMAIMVLPMTAQNLSIHVDKKGKVGFVNKDGSVVIPCKYESATPFVDGVSIVTVSGKSGIIDEQGTQLLPLKYTQIQPWTDELYLIKNGKTVGLANHRGTVVLPVIYSNISKPNCYGKALITQGGKATVVDKKTYMAAAKYGVINAQGEVLIAANYKGLYEFSFNGQNVYPYYEGWRLTHSQHFITDTLVTDCAYLGFSTNANNIFTAGVMDARGNEVVPAGRFSLVMAPKGGMVRFYNILKGNQTLCGYYNISTGETVNGETFDMTYDKMSFWSHGDFTGDIAPVNGETWSFVDKRGKKVRSGYNLLKHSQSTALWAARRSNGSWEVFDEQGHDVASLSGYADFYFPAGEADKEIFSVTKDGKAGCIDRNGNVVVPMTYDLTLGNTNDFVVVKQDGKYGVVSANNEQLVPADYIDIVIPAQRGEQHIWVRKADSLYYHYHIDTQKLATVGYRSVINFEKGFAFVVPVDLQVDDTQLNRAQAADPNSKREVINGLDMTQLSEYFGCIINTNDEVVIDKPVCVLRKDAVFDALLQLNGLPSQSQKKNILLNITSSNRSYGLKTTIGEDEWNY